MGCAFINENIELSGYLMVLFKQNLRPYSKSSLTLNEWRFNLSFSWVSMLFLNSWRVSSHLVGVITLALQLFKNSIDTREKLRLNLHSLSVSVSELLEYGRYSIEWEIIRGKTSPYIGG
jgi:hypothetical protein